MNKKLKQGTYYECLKCGDSIYYDTNKKMIYCKCGTIAVDGCKQYARFIGNPKDVKSFYVDENGKRKIN